MYEKSYAPATISPPDEMLDQGRKDCTGGAGGGDGGIISH